MKSDVSPSCELICLVQSAGFELGRKIGEENRVRESKWLSEQGGGAGVGGVDNAAQQYSSQKQVMPVHEWAGWNQTLRGVLMLAGGMKARLTCKPAEFECCLVSGGGAGGETLIRLQQVPLWIQHGFIKTRDLKAGNRCCFWRMSFPKYSWLLHVSACGSFYFTTNSTLLSGSICSFFASFSVIFY